MGALQGPSPKISACDLPLTSLRKVSLCFVLFAMSTIWPTSHFDIFTFTCPMLPKKETYRNIEKHITAINSLVDTKSVLYSRSD